MKKKNHQSYIANDQIAYFAENKESMQENAVKTGLPDEIASNIVLGIWLKCK